MSRSSTVIPSSHLIAKPMHQAILLLLPLLLASAAPLPPTSPDTVFLRWLRQQRVELSPLVHLSTSRSASSDGRGRGLYVRDGVGAIPAGTVVATVPLDSMINIEHVLVSPVLGPWLDTRPWLPDYSALALFVMYRKGRPAFTNLTTSGEESGDDGRWDPYLRWITDGEPVDSPIAPWWGESELEALGGKGSTTRALALELRALLRQQWDRVQREAADDAVLWAAVSRPSPSSSSSFAFGDFPAFVAAVLLVQSRIHGVDVKDAQGEWHHTQCLVPIADALNTGASGGGGGGGGGDGDGTGGGGTPDFTSSATAGITNTECFSDNATDGRTVFVCALTRDVAPMEELLVAYGGRHGKLSEAGLLLSYGFTTTAGSGPSRAPTMVRLPLTGAKMAMELTTEASFEQALEHQQRILHGRRRAEAAGALLANVEARLAELEIWQRGNDDGGGRPATTTKRRSAQGQRVLHAWRVAQEERATLERAVLFFRRNALEENVT